MNALVRALRQLRDALPIRPRRKPESPDERAARKYWDGQVAADHERRGVDNKHA